MIGGIECKKNKDRSQSVVTDAKVCEKMKCSFKVGFHSLYNA